MNERFLLAGVVPEGSPGDYWREAGSGPQNGATPARSPYSSGNIKMMLERRSSGSMGHAVMRTPFQLNRILTKAFLYPTWSSSDTCINMTVNSLGKILKGSTLVVRSRYQSNQARNYNRSSQLRLCVRVTCGGLKIPTSDRDSDPLKQNCSKWEPDIGSVWSSPGDSNMQPKLRTMAHLPWPLQCFCGFLLCLNAEKQISDATCV